MPDTPGPENPTAVEAAPEPESEPLPEGRTVDYTRRGDGHNYEILRTHDGGQRLEAAGWGPFMGAMLKRGDYLLLIGKTSDSSTRYQVAEVEYRMDPGDMWFATLVFAPRQHAVNMCKEATDA